MNQLKLFVAVFVLSFSSLAFSQPAHVGVAERAIALCSDFVVNGVASGALNCSVENWEGSMTSCLDRAAQQVANPVEACEMDRQSNVNGYEFSCDQKTGALKPDPCAAQELGCKAKSTRAFSNWRDAVSLKVKAMHLCDQPV